MAKVTRPIISIQWLNYKVIWLENFGGFKTEVQHLDINEWGLSLANCSKVFLDKQQADSVLQVLFGDEH